MLLGEEKHREVPGTGPPALSQYSLGLVIASLEEGEEPTHVESCCSEAVRAEGRAERHTLVGFL